MATSGDRLLEVVLGLLERRTQRAAVLERVRHVPQVRLAGVVHQGGEHVLGVTAPLLDELGHDHRVLRDRVEDPAVTAEPALVGERPRDVADVELLRIRVERVDPPARDGLQVRARSGRGVISGRASPAIVDARSSPARVPSIRMCADGPHRSSRVCRGCLPDADRVRRDHHLAARAPKAAHRVLRRRADGEPHLGHRRPGSVRSRRQGARQHHVDPTPRSVDRGGRRLAAARPADDIETRRGAAGSLAQSPPARTRGALRGPSATSTGPMPA